jgi:hypothetical protein
VKYGIGQLAFDEALCADDWHPKISALANPATSLFPCRQDSFSADYRLVHITTTAHAPASAKTSGTSLSRV